MDDEMLIDFRAESAEGLELTEQSLLAFEDGDAEAIHEAFRALHTIKGGSGFLELGVVNRLAHQMENLLDSIRQGKRQGTHFTTDLLLRGVDRLRTMLDSEDLGEEMIIDDLLADLARSLDGEDLEAPSGIGRHAIEVSACPPAEPPTAYEPTPVRGTPTLQVLESRQRHFGAFLVESGVLTCDQLLDALHQQQALALPDIVLLHDSVGVPPHVCLELARKAREHGIDVLAWAADQGHVSHDQIEDLQSRQQHSRPPLGQILTSMGLLERSQVLHLLGAFNDHRQAAARQGA